MNTYDPNIPWLESDEWHGDNGILGNRRGFEQLRERIDLLLAGNDDLVVVETHGDGVKILKLMDRPKQQNTSSFATKTLVSAIGILLATIFLLGLFTLIGLISVLFI